jgi:hypothetical protein
MTQTKPVKAYRVDNKLNELNHKIELCTKYKKEILQTVFSLKQKLERKEISRSQYLTLKKQYLQGKSLKEWTDYYDQKLMQYSRQIQHLKQSQLPTREGTGEHKNTWLQKHAIIAIALLAAVFITLFFTADTHNLTGFIAHSQKDRFVQKFEDGYSVEGMHSSPLKGASANMLCLKTKPQIQYNQAILTSKTKQVHTGASLMLGLFKETEQETLEEISSCSPPYNQSQWQTCPIDGLDQGMGETWICAYALGGRPEYTYYLMYFSNHDDKTKAKYSNNVIKQSQGSYTLRAQFIYVKQ